MKKAKIILTAITLLGIVGGTLAFKAKRTGIPAYITNGITVTSSTIAGFIYTTTVPFGVVDPLNFIGAGPLKNTFVYMIKTITGFAPNGLTRTWRELICVPTLTFVTEED